MAATKFSKPIDNEIAELNSNITTINGLRAFDDLPSTSGGSIGTYIKSYVREGHKCGIFLSIGNASDSPGSSPNYYIRYTQNMGSYQVFVEAFDFSDVSKSYITTCNISTGVLGTWEQFALSSNVTIGTITKASRVTSGTLDFTSCRKVGTVVNASGRIYGITGNSVTANGAFFTLPVGFRPSDGVTVYGNGYLYTQNGVMIPLLSIISSDGSVALSYSNNEYVTQAGFSACFAIAD